MKALRRFGSPPQRLWPCDARRFQRMPRDPFLFAFGRDYEHLIYFRLDRGHQSPNDRLNVLKSSLASGLAFVLAFDVPFFLSSDGLILNSTRFARSQGSQAAIAVGFEDAVRVGSHKGAFLIRNSWGQRWGDAGYGWLPYALVKSQHVGDLWSVTSRRWITTMRGWRID